MRLISSMLICLVLQGCGAKRESSNQFHEERFDRVFDEVKSGSWERTDELYVDFLPALLAKAQAGDAFAQNLLGEYYSDFLDEPDYTKGVEWFRKASDQKLAKAIYNLSVSYSEGLGVPKDDDEALKLAREAASLGDSMAQLVLGLRYAEGHGVIINKGEAVKWYRTAAENGLPAAQIILGNCYLEGDLLPQDRETAYMWYSIAAEDEFQSIAKIHREETAKELTPEQRASGQKRAREWHEKHQSRQ